MRISTDAAVLDVGGGASRLVDSLIDRHYDDLTVLDLSSEALAVARRRLGPRAAQVRWIAGDVIAWQPDRQYDVWHDRAVFHFLVDPGDRAGYVSTLRSSLRIGSHVIIATFASDGPEHCSGLPVARYDAGELAAALDGTLDVVDARRQEHRTPGGAVQPFTWLALVRRS